MRLLPRLSLPLVLAALILVLLVAGTPQLAHAAPPSPTAIPVVLIPGIGGTRLADSSNVEYWPAAGYADHSGLSLYPNPPHPTLYPTNAITEATFRGIHIPFEDWQTYGPLFTYLGTQGFVQYDTHQNPNLQTSAGCDLTQASNHPNLFVFAYDWRLSNAQNASLLADYIACVHKFYPGTQVNLIAHSMGGLVGRRYILDHPGSSFVNAYISVSTPFLGAGKVVWVEETGEYVFFVWASTLLNVVGSFNGASELLPSQAWYDIGGLSPLVEDGQDLLNDGNYDEQLSYAQLVQYMNSAKGQQGFTPGTANQLFHNYTNQGNAQDNWSKDTTGVQYFHIAGSGGKPDTITSVVATTFIGCLKHFSTCNLSTWMYPKFGLGDTTVPILSLTRQGPNGNFNAPNATVYTCQASGANNQNVDHTGLLSNPVVQGLLIQYLTQANGGTPQPPPSPTLCGSGGSGATATKLALHQLTLGGVTDVQVVESGTSSLPGEQPDGAQIYPVGADSVVITLDGDREYDVSFKTTGQTLYAEWEYYRGKKPAQAKRYLDQPVTPGALAHLHLAGGSLSELAYDADADGTPDANLQPTVALSGKAAHDTAPPTVQLSQVAARAKTRITLSAADKSKVAQVVYSTDGVHFQVYRKPFRVGADVTRIYAFADDTAGNRSELFTFALR